MTVYALATPLGGAIAVIRISGRDTLAALARCTGHVDWAPGQLRRVRIAEGEDVIDDAMAVYFAGPKSYTGEDMAELHIHGSRAIAQRVFALLESAGLALAGPGEFTKRAFLNGKMDLSEAEAVMDVINADAAADAQAALQQLDGALGARIRRLTTKLVDAVARLHAGIDYPEEDWEQEIARAVSGEVTEVLEELRGLLATAKQGRLLREGFGIVLAGRPNAGKSSLLNALLGQERAIVTAQAGTTRDTIEERISLFGLPVRLTDTAGLRAADDRAEALGVQRAHAAVDAADLLLLVFDGAAALTAEDYAVLALAKDRPCIGVVTKGDLPQLPGVLTAVEAKVPAVTASALEPDGLRALQEAILSYFESLGPRGQPLLVTNARHTALLERAQAALVDALSSLAAEDLDCASIDMGAALRHLGGITGECVDDEVVAAIFSRFCLGK